MNRRTLLVAALFAVACSKTPRERAVPTAPRPSILLVTLDTTRADAIGAGTPAFEAIARRGARFTQAYAAVPQTLPSHTSMLTGLYPAGHGVHENARYVGDGQALVSERLHAAGYGTAAFVSAFPLARRFGLARGFDVYDDDFGAAAERIAAGTTTRAVAYINDQPPAKPLFLWVHYYDPHTPYSPPEPFRTRYARNEYLGEVAYMDQQLGRLVQAFESHVRGPRAIILVGDHGEGLGEHGELEHGDLLYQSTMHVPLVVVGPGVRSGSAAAPVSTRRVFHTILDFAGIDATNSLRQPVSEVVAGEAMKPFLDYGWQPQVMAVEGRLKTIMAGRPEVYDVVADPGEQHDLAGHADIPRGTRATLRDYPMPGVQSAVPPQNLDDEARKKLASLGYIASSVRPVVRPDAPRPADMTPLFPLLDRAARLFFAEQYAQAVPLLEQILAKDAHNLEAALRLATAYSSLGRDAQAVAAFQRAEAIAPGSQDVQTYLALHYARGRDWQKAVPMLETIVAESPDRLPALEALAVVRERQGRIEDAVALREKIYSMRTAAPGELAKLGEMEMALGRTDAAIAAFEKAGGHDLELGVLYLAARRYADARAALDRVPSASPAYPMALFKRAQVAVLLREPDAPARIEAARQHADATTRRLIANERLFGEPPSRPQ